MLMLNGPPGTFTRCVSYLTTIRLVAVVHDHHYRRRIFFEVDNQLSSIHCECIFDDGNFTRIEAGYSNANRANVRFVCDHEGSCDAVFNAIFDMMCGGRWYEHALLIIRYGGGRFVLDDRCVCSGRRSQCKHRGRCDRFVWKQY